MASYRFCASVVSRGKGQSAVAKVAYNAREDIRDERTGEMKRFSHRPGLKLKGIATPKDVPEWAHDLAKLVNALEAREDKSNHRATAQLGHDIELNFPHELSLEECRRMLRDYNREEFTRHGKIVMWAIHAADIDEPGGIPDHPGEPEEDRSHGGGDVEDRDGEPDHRAKNPNPHAHLFVPIRPIGPDGFGNKVRDWNNSKEQLNHLREKWAELGARYLKNAGHEVEAEHYKVGHHTLAKQREIALERGDLAYAETLDRVPQKHLGPTVIAMMRRSAQTDIGNAYRDDLKYAKEETADRADLTELDRQIAQRRREIEQDAEPDPEDPEPPAQAPPAIEPEPAPPLVASHRIDEARTTDAARIEATGGGHDEDPRRIEPKPPPHVEQAQPNYEQQARAQEIALAYRRSQAARKALTAALSAEAKLTPPPDPAEPQHMHERAFAFAKKFVCEHVLPKLGNSPFSFLPTYAVLYEAYDKAIEQARELLPMFIRNKETALATPHRVEPEGRLRPPLPPPPPPKKRIVLSFKPPDPDRSR